MTTVIICSSQIFPVTQTTASNTHRSGELGFYCHISRQKIENTMISKQQQLKKTSF